MFLFEYEGKQLLRAQNIRTPESVLISSLAEAAPGANQGLDRLGMPVVIKAQVLSGGRGKRGLIREASNSQQAASIMQEMFRAPTGIRRLLVEQKVDFQRELYLSVSVEPLRGGLLLMGCSRGGVDVEQLAADDSVALVRQLIDPTCGLFGYQAQNLAYALGEDADQVKEIAGIAKTLYQMLVTLDAELVEINPLFVCRSGEVVAGDVKIVLDDNALFRHPEFSLSRERFDSQTSYDAAMEGIPYLQFGGEISLMCAGAGLANTVYDLINYEGGSVANYLEFGGPNYRKAVRAMELCLENPSRVILIVTFGTIARADVIAEGIAEAIRLLRPDRPIVTCVRGTNEEKAIEVLTQCEVEVFDDTERAVRRAVDLAKSAGVKP